MRKCVLALLSILFLQICVSKVSSCIQKERDALLRFKKSFQDPSGRLASWNSNNNNGSSNCCLWDGIACNPTTGHVIKIDLRNHFNQVDYSSYHDTFLYSNSVDSSLFEFKYLNYLDLSWNNFTHSQIPEFLGSMLELSYLNLSHASFVGNVPPHLGNLTQLGVLDLSSYYYYYDDHNQQLHIDDIEWLSHISSLRHLFLDRVNLSEALNMMHVFTSLPLLSSLSLSSCSLQNIHLSSGSFNSSFVTRVQHLDLSANNFKGPLPKAFYNMTSLIFLDLSQNHFTTIEGGLISLIGNSCRLQEFYFWYNLGGDQLFGSYDNDSMGCDSYDLREIWLTDTPMKDKIPDWLSKFKNLRSLDLERSSIYGPIPASLGNLSSLEHLDLSGNGLTGAILTSFGKLSSLEYLDLSGNGLTGAILTSFGKLSSLEYLDLSGNGLTGAIPTSFGRLSNLRMLYLYNNRLEEARDECFTQLQNLEELDISQNLLKGTLTETAFVNVAHLRTLMFWNNTHLLLDLKSNWVPPFQLQNLDGSSCIGCFGIEFPQWLRTQKALVRLSLANVSISGALPTWIMAQNLTHLDLSHNQIVGALPTSMSDQMPNLKSLILNDNLINGSLPPSLCKWSSLEFLYLSNNRLSGMVHGCLLNSNLYILDLSSNNFSGTVSYSQRNDYSSVRQLYLSYNNLEGFMPIVLKNSRYLGILDLEGNKFSGNIPIWMGNNLENLIILRLRGNLFNGTIPSSLCNLVNLQILDLAHNQLQGNVPSNLSNFQKMAGKTITKRDFGFCDGNFTLCVDAVGKEFGQSIKSSYFNYSMSQIGLMKNIDLSVNYLVGFIPSEIIMLKGLIGLNLSYNNLSGTIPIKIGKMESLESLDLSFNQLCGPIPQSISELNSLGVLKLSHNNLSGHIPREGHLSTFNQASSFDGNPHLCGDPLPVNCSSSESPFEPGLKIHNVDKEEDKWEKWMFYIMIILGYIIGFWVVVGSLILKRSWRYAYFNFVDDTKYKLHVAMWWTIKWLKRICTHK